MTGRLPRLPLGRRASVMAVAVTVAVAGAMGATLIAHSWGPVARVSPPTSVTTPSLRAVVVAEGVPAPLTAPPPGTPLILFPAERLAVGWDGRRYSMGDANLGGIQSPDGARIVYPDILEVLDVLSGSSTYISQPDGSVATLAWAEDSRHICILKPTPFPITIGPAVGLMPLTNDVLWADALLGSIRHIATINSAGGPADVQIIACNGRDHQVTVWNRRDPQSGLEVIDMATGAVRVHSLGPADQQFQATATPDGSLLAISNLSFGGVDLLAMPAMSRVGHLPSYMEVRALSQDGKLAVVVNSDPTGSGVDPEVIEIATLQVLWRAPTGFNFFGQQLAEPGGSAIALEVARSDQCPRCGQEVRLVSLKLGAVLLSTSSPLETMGLG